MTHHRPSIGWQTKRFLRRQVARLEEIRNQAEADRIERELTAHKRLALPERPLPATGDPRDAAVWPLRWARAAV